MLTSNARGGPTTVTWPAADHQRFQLLLLLQPRVEHERKLRRQLQHQLTPPHYELPAAAVRGVLAELAGDVPQLDGKPCGAEVAQPVHEASVEAADNDEDQIDVAYG